MQSYGGLPNIILKAQLARYNLQDECVLSLPVINFGRGSENDVILDEPRISRNHMRIERSAQGIFITDLGSANGVLVNGKPLTPRAPAQLFYNDIIDVPEFRLSLAPAKGTQPSPPPGKLRLSPAPQPGLVVWIEGKLSRYPLGAGVTRIGRAPDNEIIIDHHLVSRHHAEVACQNGVYTISDKGSTNGLRVGQNPVQSYPLRDEDVVMISKGEIRFQFRAFLGFQPFTTQPQAQNVTLWRPAAGANTGYLNLKGQDVLTIGRAPDNRIVLNHPQVSLHHAMIERVGTRYRIKDFKSTGGTFVNGKRVEKEAWLKIGDEIHVAGIKLMLREMGIQHLGDEGLRLDVTGLNKWVTQKKNLLQDISLSIFPHEFVALVGMSGSGKSTLMDAINGFRPATHGQVRINSVDLYHNFDMYRNEMGYVPQKDIVHQELSVYSALDYAAQLRMPSDTTQPERHARILEVLKDLDLTERKDLPIHKLSGGQLKRVSIGVELLTRPRLFFLDEPTSGLDPGTEAEMMRLLRRLADQGRTIMLITHATKNVMMCDQVIFLARGGHLAYYGPPEEALAYFDGYRTPQERQQADIEFDDIYKILNDEQRGSSKDWQQRYLQSQQYANYVVKRLQAAGATPAAGYAHPNGGVPQPIAQRKRPQTNTLRQFITLSSRNIRIIRQDKFSLALMLALAPIIGLMDFMWGTTLFDIKLGDATKIITMLFMTGLISILVGAMASVREIVKEMDIYKRERAINLKLMSYILSKVWVGVVLSIYQSAVLLLFLWIFALRTSPLGGGDYLMMLVTMFLGTLSGYLMGLFISAAAPNQNVALLLVIVVLVPQFLFSGALLPLDLIPGGETISAGVSTRWAYEAMVNITGMGRDVINDPCWQYILEKKLQPSDLSQEEKESRGCKCMGERMFDSCYFPGIQNPEYLTDAARVALAETEPPRPEQPTAFPSFTPYPSLTPLPTLTPYPTLTPLPKPQSQDLKVMQTYEDDTRKQGDTYAKMRERQGDEYTDQMKKQGSEYQGIRSAQGKKYEDLRTGQGDEYEDAMQTWGEVKEDWSTNRNKALSAVETNIKKILDNSGRTFEGTVIARWTYLSVIMVVVFGLLVLFQKLKDNK